MSDIRNHWEAEDDRLRPFGQAPDDDYLERQAAELVAEDRRQDHTPGIAPARIAVDQPSAMERREHARHPVGHRRRPWTVCQCGAWEKGYRHPGHRYRCPRYSQTDERAA